MGGIVNIMAGMALLNNMFNNKGKRNFKHNYNKGDFITYELKGEDAAWFGVDSIKFQGTITDILGDYEYGVRNVDGNLATIKESDIINT